MLSALGITEHDIEDLEHSIVSATDTRTVDETSVMDDPSLQRILTLEPTLSTMTACGNIGGDVNIHILIENTPVIPYWCLQNGVLRVEGYSREDPARWVYSGICRKYLIRKNPGKGPFKNAATFYVRYYDSDMDEYREPSIKLFHNGGFQVTGIRTPAQMREVINLVVHSVSRVEGGFIDAGAPFPERMFQEVCMMNADVRTGRLIRRRDLQAALIKHGGLMSTYESTSYQGVKISFFWSAEKNAQGKLQDGTCPCEVQCVSSGKKSSIKKTAEDTRTRCTKVTIAPFQTGKIIITGAKHEQQVRDAASWILRFLVDHATDVFGDEPADTSRKPISDPLRNSYPFVASVRKDSIVFSTDT